MQDSSDKTFHLFLGVLFLIFLFTMIFQFTFDVVKNDSDKPSDVAQVEIERVCTKLKEGETYSDTTAEYETINLFDSGKLVNCIVVTSQGIEWVF